MTTNLLIYPLGRLTIKLISLLSGFFFATVLATLPAQTGDWGVVAGGIRLIFIDNIFEQFFWKNLYIINSVKIGIIYGLFVDAFKLGS
uniref:hypothetical protein n=1 Tax=Madagascaria erythrocladioides TaxID=753684 RepID=UPI001FCD6465|nr:hypothetical protein MW574_pgp007 [Madagascaria erythrocladioides]UNJ16660.1 hypothetical protein [Madagascaria erythrocladioides]